MLKDLEHLKHDATGKENFELLWSFDPLDLNRRALIIVTPWNEQEWAQQLRGTQGLETLMLSVINGLVDHADGIPEKITAARGTDAALQRTEQETFTVNWYFDRLGRKKEVLIISTPWDEKRFQELIGPTDPQGTDLMLRVLRGTVGTNRSWISREMYGF